MPNNWVIRQVLAVESVMPNPLLFRLQEYFLALGLGNDDDAAFGDYEAALAVVIEVVADRAALRDVHVLVHDGPADTAMPTDGYPLADDRFLDDGMKIGIVTRFLRRSCVLISRSNGIVCF